MGVELVVRDYLEVMGLQLDASKLINRTMQTITYTNRSSEPITPQQAAASSDFNKLFSENGILKRIEEVRNGKLDFVVWYRALTDSETEAKMLVMESYPGIAFEIAYREPYLSYSIETYRFFNRMGEYEGKKVVLVREDNKLICQEEYDENDELEEIEKFCFDYPEQYLGFRYSLTDRSLYSAFGDESPFGPETEYIYGDDIVAFFPGLFDTLPYYADGTFLPTE
jgi:hypothetical protein